MDGQMGAFMVGEWVDGLRDRWIDRWINMWVG